MAPRSPVTPLPKRPRLLWTPEKLESGSVNVVIKRGYSSYSGLRWKNKSREREYLTRVCRCLIDYGAPAHHLEENLLIAATHLGVDLATQLTAESVLLSFSDDIAPILPLISGDWETVNLAHLRDTYQVFDAVVDFRTTVNEAILTLTEISERSNQYSDRFLVFIYGVTCACIGPLVFGARILDLPVIFLFGFVLGLLERCVPKDSRHRDVLEVLSIMLFSFTARALGSLSAGQFCFSALTQVPLVLLLPGFTITCGCLQLTSSNKGAGTSRIVYAMVYAVILGFGISVGTLAYGCINEAATSQDVCPDTAPWYFSYIFLPPLVVCIMILSQGRWQQMPAMATITISGFMMATFLRKRFVTELADLLGAFVLGCLVNIYSAVTRRSAAEMLLAGLFVQVPSGMAAHGSMVQGVEKAQIMSQDLLNSTAQMNTAALGTDSIIDLKVLVSMARVAIMLAVGFRLSAWLFYLLGQQKLNC